MDAKRIAPFTDSFSTVMSQLGFSNIKNGDLAAKGKDLIFSGVIVIVGIVGEIKGNVAYCITMEDAKNIASTMMMGMPVEEFDEISQSAISELTNMITANAATNFFDLGTVIDISTPTLLHGENVSFKMCSNEVLGIHLLADQSQIVINIAFEK